MKKFLRHFSVAFCAGVVVACFAAIRPVDATTTKQFDLPRMTSSAARVFRGTVTGVRPGKVSIGGGELATTIYRIRVVDAIKGEFPTEKNIQYAEVEMIGSPKASPQGKGVRHLPIFRDMPELQHGRDYLLFLTAESSYALSSPIGLAQGCFDIDTSIPSEPTANRLGNAGLAPEIKGPMPYQKLANRVRDIVAAQKGAR